MLCNAKNRCIRLTDSHINKNSMAYCQERDHQHELTGHHQILLRHGRLPGTSTSALRCADLITSSALGRSLVSIRCLAMERGAPLQTWRSSTLFMAVSRSQERKIARSRTLFSRSATQGGSSVHDRKANLIYLALRRDLLTHGRSLSLVSTKKRNSLHALHFLHNHHVFLPSKR